MAMNGGWKRLWSFTRIAPLWLFSLAQAVFGRGSCCAQRPLGLWKDDVVSHYRGITSRRTHAIFLCARVRMPVKIFRPDRDGCGLGAARAHHGSSPVQYYDGKRDKLPSG